MKEFFINVAATILGTVIANVVSHAIIMYL